MAWPTGAAPHPPARARGPCLSSHIAPPHRSRSTSPSHAAHDGRSQGPSAHGPPRVGGRCGSECRHGPEGERERELERGAVRRPCERFSSELRALSFGRCEGKEGWEERAGMCGAVRFAVGCELRLASFGVVLPDGAGEAQYSMWAGRWLVRSDPLPRNERGCMLLLQGESRSRGYSGFGIAPV